MNSKELKNIWEAYTQVYEEIGVPIPAGKTAKDVLEPLTKKHGGGKVVEPKKTTLQQAHYKPEGELIEGQETNGIFNDILEYLVYEGYADTNDAAIAIIANMSEEWKQNIEEVLGGQPGDGYIGHPRLGIKNPTNPPKKSVNTSPKNTGLAGKLGNRASELENAINELR